MTELRTTAPAFIEMAHRIVWATVATVEPGGQPRTRILHPIWEWDGQHITGWIATGPDSSKARHLAAEPRISLTYWDPTQDTCTAECTTDWVDDPDDKQTAWNRFLNGPEPVGYNPAIIPGWTSASAPGFGVLRLRPTRLRVFPGTLLVQGKGALLTWSGTA
jgi:general stress protein 26